MKFIARVMAPCGSDVQGRRSLWAAQRNVTAHPAACRAHQASVTNTARSDHAKMMQDLARHLHRGRHELAVVHKVVVADQQGQDHRSDPCHGLNSRSSTSTAACYAKSVAML